MSLAARFYAADEGLRASVNMAEHCRDVTEMVLWPAFIQGQLRLCLKLPAELRSYAQHVL